MKSSYSTFGRRFDPRGLTRAREAAGMSQAQLAMVIYNHEGPHRVKQLEDGKAAPGMWNLILICETLKCSIDDIAPKLGQALPAVRVVPDAEKRKIYFQKGRA